jgi:hypothetical protein
VSEIERDAAGETGAEPEGREGTDMAELWKSLPSWVRNIVVPILVLILAWNLLWFVVGVVGALLGFLLKVLLVVGLGAAVVILVKKAAKS